MQQGLPRLHRTANLPLKLVTLDKVANYMTLAQRPSKPLQPPKKLPSMRRLPREAVAKDVEKINERELRRKTIQL